MILLVLTFLSMHFCLSFNFDKFVEFKAHDSLSSRYKLDTCLDSHAIQEIKKSFVNLNF